MAKAATKKIPKSLKLGKPQRTPVAKKVAPKARVPAKTPFARAPVISKEELRNQIEKLTTANATLKAKGRETAKALKAAAARIAVLENQISQAETKALIGKKPKAKARPPRKPLTPDSGAESAPEVPATEGPEEPTDSQIA